MKLYCDREALLGDCQLASAAVASRDIKPILRNLKAVADGDKCTLMASDHEGALVALGHGLEVDKCTLMASDLELGIRLEVRSPQVQKAGEAILPAAKLVSILQADAQLQVGGHE